MVTQLIRSETGVRVQVRNANAGRYMDRVRTRRFLGTLMRHGSKRKIKLRFSFRFNVLP